MVTGLVRILVVDDHALVRGALCERLQREPDFAIVGGAADADEVIECRGQTLLPGLIDCHNHLSLDPALDNYLLRMNDSIPELTIRAVQTMAVDLASGVTTSRCLGDKGFLDIACKKAVAAGKLAGPRLLVATRGVRTLHGHGFVGYPFSGIESIRQAVRENLSAGADLIKIYITGTLRGSKGIPHYRWSVPFYRNPLPKYVFDQ